MIPNSSDLTMLETPIHVTKGKSFLAILLWLVCSAHICHIWLEINARNHGGNHENGEVFYILIKEDVRD